jgi:hypothetical protein
MFHYMILKLVGDAVSVQTTGLIFFKDTFNFERYMEQILHPFLKCLTDVEHQYDSANTLIQQGCPWTWGMFGDRIISSGLWSAHASDLNPLTFIYGNHKAKHLQIRLSHHWRTEGKYVERLLSLPTKCQCMNVDFSWACQECVWNNREHFQPIL